MSELSDPALHAAEQVGALWPIMLPLVTTAATGAWVLVRYISERRDKGADRILSREQRLMKDADDRIAAAGKIDADVIARLREELVRVSGRLIESERERDRAEQTSDIYQERARFWNSRAHDMRHHAANLGQRLKGLCRSLEQPPPALPDLSLPLFNAELNHPQ